MAKSKEKKQKKDKSRIKNEEEGEEEQQETHAKQYEAKERQGNPEKKKKKEKLRVTLETVRENSNNISPIVGYFPSGYDPLKDSTVESKATARVYRNAKKSNRLQLVVSPNGSDVNFVGTNYTGEAATAQPCTYALGVLDKETQTLKIIPVASNKIFRLEPQVGALHLPVNENEGMIEQELTPEAKLAKSRGHDNSSYLSKQTRRQIEKRNKERLIGDPATQQDLNGTSEEFKLINKEALEVAAATENARNIPPHDLVATTPDMAYPLDKIIFKGEWDSLLDILELSQVGEEVKTNVYPCFVYNRVYKLENIKDEDEKRRLAAILSYITHLVKFKDKHSMDGVSSAKHHKIPKILFQKFSDMFAISDSRRLSNEKSDLLISYVLVLTLFADNFRTDPSDIAKDLRMNAIELRRHYERLGCKLVREKELALATLPVPLQFPQMRRKRRR